MFYAIEFATNSTIKSLAKRSTLKEILLGNGIVLNEQSYTKLHDKVTTTKLVYLNDFCLENDMYIFQYLIDIKHNLAIVYIDTDKYVIAYRKRDSTELLLSPIEEDKIDDFIKQNKLIDFFVIR